MTDDKSAEDLFPQSEEEKVAELQVAITKQQEEAAAAKKLVEDEEVERLKRREKSRKEREDRRVHAFANGSFEFNVRLRRDFSGAENMAEFLRIGKRDTRNRIEELLTDPDWKKLTNKYGIAMKLIKISPSITATFEMDKD